MNRLWVRLTLAFVAVTLVGVATVAILTDWSATRQFRQYLARQDALAQTGLIDELQAFYSRNGNWNGVASVFASYAAGGGRGQGAMRGRPTLLLADANGLVVYDERGARNGSAISADERSTALAFKAANESTVGYIITSGGLGRGAAQSPEQDFLDELRRTLLLAAAFAGGLGILMGLVVSRMLAAPLANLAETARAFAGRDWSRRARVRGTQEIAAVAREINVMADSLQHSETLRRNLMADVAHELRTPLTVLQGNLRAILDGVYPLEMGEMATLYDETRVLKHLVDDLRELALADAGQLPLNLREVDIASICRAAIADFSVSAEARGVHLGVDIPDGKGVCSRSDPERVAQVLRNLIANALRHTQNGGTITVALRTSLDKVRVSVTDTGEGIGAEDLPHVFDRFYRGDKAQAREDSGTGLGLAIAKAWVEAMGGTIRVDSERGRGACFSFALPSEANLE